MSHYDRIAAGFHRRIEVIAGAVDALAPALEAAAAQIVDAALNDRRIFICGAGNDAALAAYAATSFRSGASGSPPLPAHALTATVSGDPDSLWRDLKTLSRDGDIVLFIDASDGRAGGGSGRGNIAGEAVEIARERNLYLLLLSDQAEALPTDLALPMIADDEALRRELALMCVHCLQNLIAEIMMGE